RGAVAAVLAAVGHAQPAGDAAHRRRDAALRRQRDRPAAGEPGAPVAGAGAVEERHPLIPRTGQVDAVVLPAWRRAARRSCYEADGRSRTVFSSRPGPSISIATVSPSCSGRGGFIA